MKRYCLGAFLPFVMATAAQAQSLVRDWSDSGYSTREIRALTHAYARCVVKQQPAKAAEAIVANVGNDVILRSYGMLIRDDCLTRQVHQATRMRFTGDLYRYALADALVNRELAALPPPNVQSVPSLDHHDPGAPPQATDSRGRKLGRRKLEMARRDYDRAAAYAFLSRYGECIVRADAAGAKALLLTEPDSGEESTRFGALGPVMSRCLPEGQTLRFGKVALRGSVAINYYRLARAGGAR